MSLPPPIAYADNLETVLEDEAKTIESLSETFDTIQQTTAEDYGHAVRAVHAKAHGLFEGILVVDDNLPPELAQGLFASAGERRVILRLSTNAGDILDDAISLPRGVAMKVLDVQGEALPGSEAGAQDFIMVNGKTFQSKSADKFLANLKLLAKSTDKAEGAKVAFSAVMRGVSSALGAIGIESATVNTLGGAPNSEPLGETYNSVTPFRYGDYVAKFRLRPLTPGMNALTGQTIDTGGDEDAVRNKVREEAGAMDLAWEFGVQLCRNLEGQPIEDPTAEWDEEQYPFQRVGEVRAAAQDSWSNANVATVDACMQFNIWNALAAHRPLGNINRARRETYRHAAEFRSRVNGCPMHQAT